MNLRHFIALALFIAPVVARAQGIITTVAGSDKQGFSGDKGPATKAGLNGPSGVAFDALGNLYIADQVDFAIRKVDKNGTITTVAGCGSLASCQPFLGGNAIKTIVNPYDIVVDKAGNIYATDGSRNAVVKVSTSGIMTAFAGTGNPGVNLGDGGPADKASLETPVGMDIDSSGNIYIADLAHDRIRKVTPGGIISTVAGGAGNGYAGDGGKATSAKLNNPHGVAVDAVGNLYIADTNNFVVRKVDKSGIITTIAGIAGQIVIIGPAPEGVPATTVPLVSPWAVTVDKAGNLYIAEWLGYRVRKVDKNGIVTTFAGNGSSGFSGDGGPATSAMFKTPEGMRFDSAGNMYVADNLNNRVRKISQPHAAPVVNALGVVNNASFAPGSNAVAPGSIAAVFGSNMNDGSNVLFSSFGADGKLVATLADAQVTVNGERVPIFYATPNQLGIQIPTDLTGSSATIVVKTGGLASAIQNISVAPTAPGLFSTDQSGHGQGAILIANTNTLVAPTGSIPGRDSRPAKPGDFITIFCTGLGVVSPALDTGERGANNTTVAKPTVTIDGNQAVVEFSGNAPGFVGLDQINVQVPASTRTGNDIPIVVTIGGQQSNTVTIAVSGT